MLPPPPPPIRSWRARAFGLAALVVVLTAAVLALRGRVAGVAGQGGLPGLGVGVVVVSANILGNGILIDAWRRLVGAVGPLLPFPAAARVWTVSQLARYTVGAAQVAGRALAGRSYGVGASAGALTTLVEIAWGMSLTAAVVLGTAPWWLPGAGDLEWVALLAVAPTVVVIAGLVAPQRLLGGLASLLRGPVLRRLGGDRLTAGLDTARVDRRLTAGVTVRYLAVIALRILAALALLGAVGGDIRQDGLRTAGAWALGQVVGALAVFAPGGLGPREGATALLLAPAVGVEGALLFVALLRLGEVVAELLGFLVARLGGSPASSTSLAP